MSEQGVVKENDSRLINAIISKQSVDDILTIIELDPKAVERKDNKGNYPLHHLCRSWRHDEYDIVIMKLLDIFPQAAQTTNDRNNYPLHLACRHNKSDDVIMKLMAIFPTAAEIRSSYKFPPEYVYTQDEQYVDGDTALHIACQNFNERIVEILLRHPTIDVNAINIDGDTTLHIACHYGNDRIVEMLLRHPNIDVNHINHYGYGVLHKTLEPYVPRRYTLQSPRPYGTNFVHIVEMLLQHPDINGNATNSDGDTALHLVIKHFNQHFRWRDAQSIIGNHLDLVKLLLHHPFIMIDQTNHDNKTPLDLVTNRINQWLRHRNHDDAAVADAAANDDNGDFITNQINRYLRHRTHDEYMNLTLPYYLEMKRLLEDFPVKCKLQSYQYLLQHVEDWSQ